MPVQATGISQFQPRPAKNTPSPAPSKFSATEVLESQPRFKLSGEASAKGPDAIEVVPASRAAKDLLASPQGPELEDALQMYKVIAAEKGVNISGLALSTSASGFAANTAAAAISGISKISAGIAGSDAKTAAGQWVTLNPQDSKVLLNTLQSGQSNAQSSGGGQQASAQEIAAQKQQLQQAAQQVQTKEQQVNQAAQQLESQHQQLQQAAQQVQTKEQQVNQAAQQLESQHQQLQQAAQQVQSKEQSISKTAQQIQSREQQVQQAAQELEAQQKQMQQAASQQERTLKERQAAFEDQQRSWEKQVAQRQKEVQSQSATQPQAERKSILSGLFGKPVHAEESAPQNSPAPEKQHAGLGTLLGAGGLFALRKKTESTSAVTPQGGPSNKAPVTSNPFQGLTGLLQGKGQSGSNDANLGAHQLFTFGRKKSSRPSGLGGLTQLFSVKSAVEAPHVEVAGGLKTPFGGMSGLFSRKSISKPKLDLHMPLFGKPSVATPHISMPKLKMPHLKIGRKFSPKNSSGGLGGLFSQLKG